MSQPKLVINVLLSLIYFIFCVSCLSTSCWSKRIKAYSYAYKRNPGNDELTYCKIILLPVEISKIIDLKKKKKKKLMIPIWFRNTLMLWKKQQVGSTIGCLCVKEITAFHGGELWLIPESVANFFFQILVCVFFKSSFHFVVVLFLFLFSY